MKVPLPNLDDRRWSDLIEEGRALIPVYAPDWTDHNVHDPGITLMELFAWIAEMDIYELDRITDLQKRKFLALVGVRQQPTRAAHTVLSLSLKDGSAPVRLEPGVIVSAVDPFGVDTRFSLLEPVNVADGTLAVVQWKDVKGFHDVTAKRQRKEVFSLFGPTADRGNELYLGFTKPLQPNLPVRLYFKFDGGHSGFDERQRLIEQERDRLAPCPNASDCLGDDSSNDSQLSDVVTQVPPLNRVRLTWEALVETKGTQSWITLDPAKDELRDDTRSLTLDGGILFRVPTPMALQQLGHSRTPLYYIRGRLEAGGFDSPPSASAIVMNSARAEQAVPVASTWIINAGVVPQGNEPNRGDVVAITAKFDDQGHVTAIRFDAQSDAVPAFRVLEFVRPAAARAGLLSVETLRLGAGNGWPHQSLELPVAAPVQSTLKLFSEENGAWRFWQRVDDFLESTRRDVHFVLDETNGKVVFGDGEHGRVPPGGANLFASYDATRGESGNLAAGTTFTLVDFLLNRIILGDFDSIVQRLSSITNPIEASGGAPPETLDLAIARAVDLVGTSGRAVTLKDYEALARKTPGARIARAAARANLHSSFPCFSAPGVITVTVLPDMPGRRPLPSEGLLRDVSTYLSGRRVIGTRVQVVAPRYLEVSVRATVKLLQGASKAGVQQRIVDAINEFFNPLHGGPDKTGWPFGRDVFRSEVMQVIDEIEGVDHVLKLELIPDSCEPQCGNVCLAPTWLVAAGSHQISVV